MEKFKRVLIAFIVRVTHQNLGTYIYFITEVLLAFFHHLPVVKLVMWHAMIYTSLLYLRKRALAHGLLTYDTFT